ncbi:hypothetical protein [Streptomyces sp. MBT53]|uniref:hypothetical protein n=1 Tax=Streptomyces sp. MBT53 TaxID=1488384 RepID=UPI0019123D06|nr:hypothetical protein [Streptomyces sp. MBT53]MBK6015808.1 hypothetical protein [Streptomyces sp. MBT53]
MMPLDGLDKVLEALEGAARPPRRRRTRIGWRQVTAQLLFVVAVAAFVAAVLAYGHT